VYHHQQILLSSGFGFFGSESPELLQLTQDSGQLPLKFTRFHHGQQLKVSFLPNQNLNNVRNLVCTNFIINLFYAF